MDLSEIIEVKSRFSYSERGTSALVNATLRAFEIPIVIDKSEIRRAQKKNSPISRRKLLLLVVVSIMTVVRTSQ